MDGLQSAFQQAVGAFKKGKETFDSLPDQFGAAYELAKPTIRKVTLPLGQVFEGTMQRVNNPSISGPVSPIERMIFNNQQKMVDSGQFEHGSDNFVPNPVEEKKQRNIDIFYENLWPSREMEQTASASIPWDQRPRMVSTTPELQAVRDQYLKHFTPIAQYQLSAVPFGVESPLSGSLGTAQNFNNVKSITFQEQSIGKPNQAHIAIHELLHTAARGYGGIPWNDFLRDFTALTIQDPQIAHHFSGLDKYHQTEPEEIYAELGAFMGPYVFNTPLGKYYEGILEKPNNRINMRRAR